MNQTQPYTIVIPARLESQRLPNKVLRDLAGRSMLQRVWEQARASHAEQVIIATDSELIRDAALEFGADARMTDTAHQSGSDRIAELVSRLGWADERVIVNLQGDEPLMPPTCLDQVAELVMSHPAADAATLYWPLDDPREATDPNLVKLVSDRKGRALLFSRAPIPHYRADVAGAGWKRHIGLYGYRAGSLARFSRLPQGPLERAERLEQLRYLEHGGQIIVARAAVEIPAGVDTEADLERVRSLLK